MEALLNLQTPLEFVNVPCEEQLAQIVTWGQHINTLVTQLGQEREPIHRVLEDLHSRAQNMSTAWETLYKILQGWQPTLQRMEADVGTINGLQGGVQWCKDRLAEVCIGLQQMHSASSDSEGAGSRQTHRVEELGQAREAWTGQVLTLKNHLREWDGRVRTLESNVQWVKDQLEARLASFASDLGVLHAALPAQQPQTAEPSDSWMQKWEAFQLTLLEKIQKDQRDLHKALQRHLGETEARRQTEWAQEKAALLCRSADNAAASVPSPDALCLV